MMENTAGNKHGDNATRTVTTNCRRSCMADGRVDKSPPKPGMPGRTELMQRIITKTSQNGRTQVHLFAIGGASVARLNVANISNTLALEFMAAALASKSKISCSCGLLGVDIQASGVTQNDHSCCFPESLMHYQRKSTRVLAAALMQLYIWHSTVLS